MAANQSVRQRWENYQASKTMLFWSCAVCIVGTVIIGFAWGGWVTGGTAGEMVRKADRGARAELAAAICVDRFENGPDAAALIIEQQNLGRRLIDLPNFSDYAVAGNYRHANTKTVTASFIDENRT